MSRELRELLNQLETKTKEVNTLTADPNATLEQIENASNELTILQAKIETQKQVDAATNTFSPENRTPVSPEEPVAYNGALFVKAMADTILKSRGQKGFEFTDGERNALTINVGEDGGYALPEDMSTQINRLLEDSTDLSNLTGYELVKTKTGSRLYSKRSAKKPMQPLVENKPIPSAGDSPQLQKFTWNLKGLADFMSIPNDLLEFADASLEAWVIDWFVDKVRITRNHEILFGEGGDGHAIGIFTSNAYEVVKMKKTPALNAFKEAKNVTLNNLFKPTAKWIVNQDGFNYLDTLEDKTGRPYLQPDVTKGTGYLFLGLPVLELPNEVMPTTSEYIPILLGDTKQGYKWVSNGTYSLATTNIGAGAFETNTTKARIMTNLDGNALDNEALIKIQIPVDGIDVVTPVAAQTTQEAPAAS